MPNYLIAPTAKRDIATILAWTQQEFGADVRVRYEALLIQAVRDVAATPDLPGSQGRSELVETARTYHLT